MKFVGDDGQEYPEGILFRENIEVAKLVIFCSLRNLNLLSVVIRISDDRDALGYWNIKGLFC